MAQAPPRATSPNRPLIELTDVSKLFAGPPQVLALNDVSLSIAAGDYVSVMGPSGSGKSTLLNVLGLMDRPTVGQYTLDGIATGALNERDRSRLRGTAFGFVFQAFHLLARRTVWENVALGMAYSGLPRAGRAERVDEALAKVDLTHRAWAKPSTLSGGERQRVAIARAIAAGPTLLLADEPTGNLDEATSSGILEVFDALHREGLTLLVVTHDPKVAARAARRITMRDGRIEGVTAA
jgi:putative ABC transport system ATP-binding protein